MVKVKKVKRVKKSARKGEPGKKLAVPKTSLGPSAWHMDPGLKMNLYGRAGTGKTTLWGTFPKPIAALICSGAGKPGELRSLDTPEYRETIEAVIVSDTDQIPVILGSLENRFKTLVLDHATGLQDLVLQQLLGIDELPAQKSWGIASREQWGQCSQQTKEFLRSILSFTGNVVIVAQEREFNVDAERADMLIPYVGSALTPSITGWLNTACDYIGQTFIRAGLEEKTVTIGAKEVVVSEPTGEIEYCLRIGPHPVYMTRFRKPRNVVLPDVIVDPTYEAIQAFIEGDL